MLDQKPYLVRAIYDWIADSGYTPYLQLLVNFPGVVAPEGFDEDGVLVLNISQSATSQLQITNEFIGFFARFRGQAMPVHVPMAAVLAVFAKENAQGMGFPAPDINQALEDNAANVAQTQDDSTLKTKRDRSHLRVVK